MRDKLWFFWTGRHIGSRNTVAGIFVNRNAGDITKWTYDPDSTTGGDDNTTKNSSIRLTWQASPRNKFGVWWDEQKTCQSCDRRRCGRLRRRCTGGSLSPEADGSNHNPIRMAQVAWTSPVTSRLLLEASFGLGPERVVRRQGACRGLQPEPDSRSGERGPVPGIAYRGQDVRSGTGARCAPTAGRCRTSPARTASRSAAS